MLLSLSIKNYALIEALEIDFSDNFSVITGETGAGKSILLGALGLVLGNRADLTSLKNKEEKCVVEARFLLANYDVKPFFEANDFDYEDETIIRREILPSGKSRAFVNDSPVNISELQELANRLIDIHSQHQTRDLIDEAYQTDILDTVADNKWNVSSYRQKLAELRKVQRELGKLQEEKESLQKEQEYNRFLWQELLEAKLITGEQETFEEEQETLGNVEFIRENLDTFLSASLTEETGVLAQLTTLKQALQKISGFSREYSELYERITSLSIEFKDISDECFSLAEKIVNDPERLAVVEQKLQTIYTLQKKHQAASVAELLEIQQNLEAKVQKTENVEENITQLQQEITELTDQTQSVADIISQKRKEAAPLLSGKIETIIGMLGMPDAKVVFDVEQTQQFSASGADVISFNFSANKGMALGSVKKVASGGEMSRIMLAVKSVLAEYSNLPTIIFDEIDTGISGEIAVKMGEIMREMSKNMQVFAITHLPQVAAKGDTHYKVFKYNKGEETFSELKLLAENERIIEIAEMLSGKNITNSAMQHAKSLLLV